LGADLSRFLDGKPILARPTPLWERGLKWSRRRPAVAASLAVTAAATIALVVGWIVYTAQLQIARDDAESSRDKAKDAAELAEAHARIANTNAKLAESRREDAQRQLVRAERNSVWAMEAVDKLLTKVGDQKLAGVPEMDEVRRELLEDALKYCQGFLKDRGDPDPVARRAVGLAYQSIGRLHRVMGQPADAANDFAEAIATQRKLADEFPDVHAYRHELARSLYNLYLVQLADTSLSRERVTQNLLQSVEIRQRLITEQPEIADYRWSLAKNLIALGPHYRSRQPEKTESIYKQARELIENLIANEPDKIEYLDDLKILLGNVSVLQWNRGQQAAAIETSREACSLAERVIAVDPRNPRYQFRLASAYERLATNLWLAGRASDAIEPYDQALVVLERLAREHPSIDEYPFSLSRLHRYVGLFHRSEGQHALALANVEKSVAIMKNLVAVRPSVKAHQLELAENYVQLGTVRIDHRQYEAARDLTVEAVAILEPTMTVDDAIRAANLDKAYSQLGFIHHVLGDLDAALEWHNKAVQLAEAVAARHPTDVDSRRAGTMAYRGRAATLDARNQLQEALAAWDKSLSFAVGDAKHGTLVGRATTLARLGDHAAAVAAVKPIEELNFRHEVPPHNVGIVYAFAAEAARHDEKLPAADREQLAERYSSHAVELLSKVFDRGDFNTPSTLRALREDPALNSLRLREDFKRLIERTVPNGD
jgi:tetratricopeptide (TPR) repeat protein